MSRTTPATATCPFCDSKDVHVVTDAAHGPGLAGFRRGPNGEAVPISHDTGKPMTWDEMNHDELHYCHTCTAEYDENDVIRIDTEAIVEKLTTYQTLRAEYAIGLARTIRKEPKEYGCDPAKVEADENGAVERYADSLAGKMLDAARGNGAHSINLSNILRGALERTGYARTFDGLAEALEPNA